MCRYMSLCVYYVIYNRFNNVYTETDLQKCTSVKIKFHIGYVTGKCDGNTQILNKSSNNVTASVALGKTDSSYYKDFENVQLMYELYVSIQQDIL